MIIFGGNDCSSTNFGDVWILQNANGLGGTPTWTQLSPTGIAPAPREATSAVYDAANNRMTIFDGVGDSSVWVLTNANGTGGTPAWVQLSPSGTFPPGRAGHSAVYDATNNIMTIFGGVAGSTVFNDVWVLSNANGFGSPAWTQLNPTLTTGPDPRFFHRAVYNPTTNKMTIFAGQNNTINLRDVWVISHANGL